MKTIENMSSSAHTSSYYFDALTKAELSDLMYPSLASAVGSMVVLRVLPELIRLDPSLSTFVSVFTGTVLGSWVYAHFILKSTN